MAPGDVHVEPFLHLVDVTSDAALVAWGAFHFVRDSDSDRWEIVDDSDLPEFGRHTCIGHDAEPFGEARFVVSLGDNIYQGEQGAVDDESGGEDDDWYSSFFGPYRYALARVPFFPTIGNHDTTDTEGSDDRAQMEDNFHLAARFDRPGRSSTGPGLF